VAQKLDVTTTNGLYVNDLVPGGGAEQAGLHKGDIIVKVEGNPVYESSDLQERVGRLQPGDKINVTVLRDGKDKDFAVTLKGDAVAPSNRIAASKSAEELFNKLGASFHALTPTEKARLHVNAGVLVTQVREGGLFDAAEIPEGVVITSINKLPIASIDDIDKAIVKPIQGNIIIAGIYPDGSHFSSAFPAQ
jgi:serine protease Do